MSWSVSYIGTPENVAEALESYVSQSGLSGFSKDEYEHALPHLLALVRANFVDSDELPLPRRCLRLEASRSDSYRDGKPVVSECKVSIEPLYGNFV